MSRGLSVKGVEAEGSFNMFTRSFTLFNYCLARLCPNYFMLDMQALHLELGRCTVVFTRKSSAPDIRPIGESKTR